jgi:hypothetical protein
VAGRPALRSQIGRRLVASRDRVCDRACRHDHRQLAVREDWLERPSAPVAGLIGGVGCSRGITRPYLSTGNLFLPQESPLADLFALHGVAFAAWTLAAIAIGTWPACSSAG